MKAPAPSILDLPPEEAHARLTEWGKAEGLPAYRVNQIHRRLWVAPVATWNDATELPKALRARVETAWPLPRLEAEIIQQSSDGTRKFLWRLADGERIE